MDTMASSMATAVQRPLRRPGWLLIATVGAAVLYIVSAVVTMPVDAVIVRLVVPPHLVVRGTTGPLSAP